MRGHIVRRDRKYYVVVNLGRDPETGKRRQRWHSGYSTKKQAEAALAELVTSVNSGTYVTKSTATLSEFATEWLEAIEPTIRPATHYSYSRNLRLHVLPYMGSAPLVSIDAGIANGLYARLLASGRKNHAGGGLSPRSVHYIHAILHRMFKDAVRWGRLARNPIDAADPPRPNRDITELRTWSAEELRVFLAGTAAHRLSAAFLVLATTGMRRGECLGLRWQDVDLDLGRVAIRQTLIVVNHHVQFGQPKTAKGRRMVSLDPTTVTALREHRRRQATERLQMGSGWRNHDLVFTRIDGSPLHPERFSGTFADQARQLGLPAIRLHDLRHGWATLALAAGEHPKVVQERLGHANVSITLDIYSHVTPGLHADAARRVADVIFGTHI